MPDNGNGKAGCAKLDLLLWLHAHETALPTDVTGCWLLTDATGCGADTLSDYLPPKLAAWAVCGAFGVGTLAGSVIGGEVGNRIYVWKKHCIAYLLGTCQILAIGHPAAPLRACVGIVVLK